MRRSAEEPGPSRLHGAIGRLLEAMLVVCGWLLLPLLPFVAWAIARDSSYVRRYPSSITRIVGHISATWRSDAISRAWMSRFDASGRGHGVNIVGSCTHCGNCCLHHRCVFLGMDRDQRSFCRIYGGKVWRQLTCGVYPLNQMDIDLYACPSFSVRPELAGRDARVIPIRPVFAGQREDKEGRR